MDIKPFTIAVPDSDVDDLFSRVRNTRWSWDVVSDWSRGVPTDYARKLADRWAGDYDWRAQEAALNAFPQFMGTCGHLPHRQIRMGIQHRTDQLHLFTELLPVISSQRIQWFDCDAQLAAGSAHVPHATNDSVDQHDRVATRLT